MVGKQLAKLSWGLLALAFFHGSAASQNVKGNTYVKQIRAPSTLDIPEPGHDKIVKFFVVIATTAYDYHRNKQPHNLFARPSVMVVLSKQDFSNRALVGGSITQPIFIRSQNMLLPESPHESTKAIPISLPVERYLRDMQGAIKIGPVALLPQDLKQYRYLCAQTFGGLPGDNPRDNTLCRPINLVANEYNPVPLCIAQKRARLTGVLETSGGCKATALMKVDITQDGDFENGNLSLTAVPGHTCKVSTIRGISGRARGNNQIEFQGRAGKSLVAFSGNGRCGGAQGTVKFTQPNDSGSLTLMP